MSNFLNKISSDTKGFPIGVKLIVFVVFLRTFGWGLIDPFFSMYIDGFGDSYSFVGALMAIMNFVALLAVVPLLRLADKVADTKIMRDGEVLHLFAVLFYLAAGLTGQLLFLIPGLALNGVGTAFIVVGAESYVRRHSKKSNQTSIFAFLITITYLGWVLGMILGGLTVQYYGFTYMFLFLLPSIVMGFIILKQIRETGLKTLTSGLSKYFHRPKDFGFIIEDIKLLNRKTLFLLLLAFFDGTIVMFSYVFIPLFALSIDLSLQNIAFLMAAMYMPFIFSFIISEATDKLKRMNVIAMGLFIGGLAFVLLTFIIDQMWVVLLAAITSLSLAIIRPTYNGFLTQLTPRRMLGEITGLNKIAVRVGFIFGPIFSGYLADKYSIQVAFFAISIFAFALATLALLFKGFEVIKTKS